MGNVRVFNIGIIRFHGKKLLRQMAIHQNTEDLTMKQMFDISEKLVSEQDEIYGVKSNNWESSSRKYLSLVGDEHIINLLHAKVFAFSYSIVFCKDEREPSIKHGMGTEIGVVQKFNGIRVEYLPRIQYVAAQSRSQTFTVEID